MRYERLAERVRGNRIGTATHRDLFAHPDLRAVGAENEVAQRIAIFVNQGPFVRAAWGAAQALSVLRLRLDGMEKVLGLGGIFFRARDPMGLAQWYQNNLGLSVYPATDEPWQQEAGPTVFAPFEVDTEYFGRPDQQSMVNFRVRDLDAMLAQLREAGAAVDDEVMEESYGRFGWVTDPEGNRVELWQPLP